MLVTFDMFIECWDFALGSSEAVHTLRVQRIQIKGGFYNSGKHNDAAGDKICTPPFGTFTLSRRAPMISRLRVVMLKSCSMGSFRI